MIFPFRNLGGKRGFKIFKISQKMIAMCDPEIAKICTRPDLLKSCTTSLSISVRSARMIPFVNSRAGFDSFEKWALNGKNKSH